MSKKNTSPPLIAELLLRLFTPAEERASILGDFDEYFEIKREQSCYIAAALWYWKQVIGFMPVFFRHSIKWRFTMFKNYLLTAYRNMLKKKLLTSINILGLATGLTCTVLILFWISSELSFDTFHKNRENIYRVMSYGTKYMINGYDGAPAPLATEAVINIPEVKNSVRILEASRSVFRYRDKTFYEAKGIVTEKQFFEIFSFPFIHRTAENPLKSDELNIVITEKLSNKYFGEENPIGKVINIDGDDIKVCGVIKDLPRNSHLDFDYVLSFKVLSNFKAYTKFWGGFNFVTYLQTVSSVETGNIAKELNSIAQRNKCPQVVKDGVRFRMEPLSEAHFNTNVTRNFLRTENSNSIKTFLIIAILILLIAWINFMNLSTASSTLRCREVGLRKSLGATKKQLIVRFLSESLLISTISGILTSILIVCSIPAFNYLADKEISISEISLIHLLIFSALIIITGIVSGSYSAFYLTSFNPIDIFRLKSKKGGAHEMIRKLLVIGQFVISASLIIGALIVYQQRSFIKNKELGFTKEKILCIPASGNIPAKSELFKAEIKKHSAVEYVTASSYLFSDNSFWSNGYLWEGKPEDMSFSMIMNYVDYNYFEALDLKFLEGRPFSADHSTDTDTAFILNETAVKKMGIKDPVGKRFEYYGHRKGRIVGVVKDANFKSLYNPIAPHVFMVLNKDNYRAGLSQILIKFRGNNTDSLISSVKKIWNKINRDIPFEFSFLDQRYERLYLKEKRVGNIIMIFTLLAVILSCSGIFGLTTFILEQKFREIGIRKTLGASSISILNMLTGKFIVNAVIANVIAAPVSYFAMNKWLSGFAYKIDISPLPFILTLLFSSLIVMITIAMKSWKAVSINPVEALRTEA